MSGLATEADDKTESGPQSPGIASGRSGRVLERSAAGTDRARSVGAKLEPSVEEFLRLLARALQHVHTYPSSSPLCVDAVSACHTALACVQGSEHLVFVVEPHQLRAGETTIGAGSVIGCEIARRLHHARVSMIEIDPMASVRDLTRFCEDVVAAPGGEAAETLAETLVEHGVDRITLTMAHRPEVIHLGAPPAARTEVLALERRRRESATLVDGPSIHLYPPDAGWIRTDPGVDLGPVTLPDLAILVDEPTTLATLLLRLADDDPNGPAPTPAAALERKFSDVTKVFSALDPQLARVMFGKLAGAVLALDSDRRKQLLKRTVLPGLLDGEPDGAVLWDFPDVDLAGALSLLLDVETAAPELLATALDRLELPADRREVMATLLEEHLHTRLEEASSGQSGGSALDERTRQLLRVSTGDYKSFQEFWAYDLSIDADTAEVISRFGASVRETDPLKVRLACAFHLVRLEPSPVFVERLLRSLLQMLGDLERAERWDEVEASLIRLAQLAEELRSPRPDVADAIANALGTHFDGSRVSRLVEMHEAGGAQQTSAAAIVEAIGVSLAAPLFERLNAAERQAQGRSVAQLMSAHAARLAPGLVGYVGQGTVLATAILVRVLGCAGAGYEEVIATQLDHPDDAVVRESLRALARIGTPTAASAVGAVIRQRGTKAQGLAEEALWHFPAEEARVQLLELLQHHDFVMASPKTVVRMLDRAGRSPDHGLEPALAALVSFRFRFWNPSLRRVGTRARSLLLKP